MTSYEDLVRQLELERAQLQQERAQRQAAESRADVLEKAQAPSSFLDYLRHADEQLYSTFHVSDSSRVPSSLVPRVHRKFYPRFLRPWADFPVAHAATFNKLATAFGDQALFPSRLAVEAIRREYLERDLIDTEDFDTFMRTAVEKPAARIVSRYLSDFVPRSTAASVQFRNNAHGVLPAEPPDSAYEQEMLYSTADRWGFAFDRENNRTRIFAGHYKAPHKLPAEKLRRVMSANPGDDFFLRAIKADSPDGRSATQTRVSVSDHVSVAYALCEAYNLMIASGLGFSYIASGDGLLFLRVLENDPSTLHYFWSVFPVAALPDQAARREANTGARTPQETAMAHVTSFCLLAADSAPQPASWTRKAERLLKRWPEPYGKADRPVQDGRNAWKFVVEPPTLPYCTQACLLGLSRGLALDEKCPNVALHRAARCYDKATIFRHLRRDKRKRAAGDAQPIKLVKLQESSPLTPPPDRHTLTAGELRALVVAQVAANVDKDIECLDKDGLYGRFGALFKITATGFGYTFVAKGVQEAHLHKVWQDKGVYEMTLPSVQGRLIPVCLGHIEVKIPLHTGAEVRHLLLLSYAGPDLASLPKKDVPPGVDLEKEEARTTAELAALGLWNEDMRDANLAWNAEVRRVMQFDFGQICERMGGGAPPELFSPLVDRTDTNAQRGSNQDADGGQPAKRVRIKEE